MNRHALIKKLKEKTPSKIVLLVMDGLGGLPHADTGRTELESAKTPNLDQLAYKSALGQTVPIAPGITPGSGPAHLSLFGYDPLEHDIGRGILSALGIDFPVDRNDVAARVNFCSVDENFLVTDRRAGRIPTEKCAELCRKIEEKVKLPGVQVFIRPEKEHRAALILRGEGLSDKLSDTDPQSVGKAPLPCLATEDSPASKMTAEIMSHFLAQVREILKEDHPANFILVRGFAKHPAIETMEEIYGLKCAAIAVYPMYRGLATLVGMDVLPAPQDAKGQFQQLREVYDKFDFFFIHLKYTDSRGEDGNYEAKMKVIEEYDQYIPEILTLNPDVLVITGDHSTPSQMKGHSWHPVPFLLFSKFNRPDRTESFSETNCARGSLGTFPAMDAMSLMMAHAMKLQKYGA